MSRKIDRDTPLERGKSVFLRFFAVSQAKPRKFSHVLGYSRTCTNSGRIEHSPQIHLWRGKATSRGCGGLRSELIDLLSSLHFPITCFATITFVGSGTFAPQE